MNLSSLTNFILSTKPNNINFIDVGASNGSFYNNFKKYVNNTSIKSIGIDPIIYNSNVYDLYDYFFECAIDDVDTEIIKEFCINIDPGCNSLLNINSKIVTSNENEKNNLWYCPRNITTILNKKQVKVNSLKNILDNISFVSHSDTIHLLKVDAQGVDIRVVKSMKNYLSNVMFLIMEVVTSKNKDIVLYEGQTTFQEDFLEMDKLGFSVFQIFDYSNICPEADVVFINKKWLNT